MFNISSGPNSCGVELNNGATWSQSENARLIVVASGSGINCEHTLVYHPQRYSSLFEGILFNTSDNIWIQEGPVSISVHGNDSCG